MAGELDMVLCYNKGCGQKFKLEDNIEDACTYHPGTPYFHDAYKSWSCCKKRSTDFTTFLNMKGCTVGKHNPEKPPEPVKQTNESDTNEVIVVEPNKPQNKICRPNIDLPLERLKVSVTQSLKNALENVVKSEEKGENEVHNNSTEGDIKKGEPCKNNSCSAAYDGEFSNLDDCNYHPGVPIFHEGLKYWSCCRKKSTDFNDFLNQKGCTTGKHVWIKKVTKKVHNCRYDWHQTGTHVFVTVYAKNPQPDLTYIEVNPIRLKLHIVFGEDVEFEIDSELRGIINIEESAVSMAATKVEVKLRKGEPLHWNSLFVEKKIIDEENKENDVNDKLCEEIETVDLSEI